MQIEPATIEDARAIADIHIEAWRAAYRSIVSTDYLDTLSIEEKASVWRKAIIGGTPQLLVARIEDEIVGWIAFGPCRDEGAKDDEGEIWSLYVKPACWSKGARRQLWCQAREYLIAQGFKTVRLWVLADNAQAIGFYRAMGFVCQSETPQKFFLNGQSLWELCYARTLADE
ncbi:N-acetyltransferase family protein [Halomonas sp. GXIMD04776]|uniref:GNAT family N-acetyltransferase n=1 Tax=Halomonas sp. GXIMD04776 TaxID=3415605 RepID=UPI003CBA3CEB